MDTTKEYLELCNYATTHVYQELTNNTTVAERIPTGKDAISGKASNGKVVNISWRNTIGFLCLNLFLVIIVSVLTSVATMYIADRRHEGKMATTTLNGSLTQKGETGDFSNTGQMGSTGLPGSQGQKGQMGSTGLPGSQGQKGQKGDKGKAKTCDQGWSFFERHCYYFGSDSKTWNDAKSHCESMFGNLVKIENAAENVFLKTVIEDRLMKKTWIGANDLQKEGVMRWVSDDSAVDSGFSDWAPGEPNNKDFNEDCVEFDGYPTGSGLKWNDDTCSITVRYICKK